MLSLLKVSKQSASSLGNNKDVGKNDDGNNDHDGDGNNDDG